MSKNTEKTKCQICDNAFKSITDSHARTHGISLNDYNLLFDNSNGMHCQYSIDADQKSFCNIRLYNNSVNNFCILHDTNPEKDVELFNKVFIIYIQIMLESGRDILLQNIHFPSDLIFSTKVIKSKLSFKNSFFYGSVDLSKKTFEKRVSFSGSTFKGSTNFSNSIFQSEVEFGESKFNNLVTFEDAAFAKGVGFWKTEFHNNANFVRTKFKEKAVFMTSSFPISPFYISFMDTHFEKPNLVQFSDLNIKRALFRWTDLTEIKFENINWSKTSKISGARRYLADEFHDWKSEQKKRQLSRHQYFDYVQDLYQQLKRNFEDRRSFAEAGDFYYGEMECKRKSHGISRFLPTWINLYRITSGYGQRYVRAGLILLLMIVIFSMLHMTFGLTPTAQNFKYHKIHYSFNFDFVNTKSYITDFAATSMYCIEVLTREEEQDRLFTPMNMVGESLNVTLSIVIYIQVLFFILSLRRHFKR